MSQTSSDGYGDREGRTRRNIRIGNRRTSIKLEPEMWDALAEICARTEKNLNEICTEVHTASGVNDPDDIPGGANFTSELRVFILDFYRAAAAGKYGRDLINVV
ncbi:MAG: ribbon-helix-helix domain-containing protein [Alphaproteobacteria bacterium]|nr:ribbon-helix-helix domain-containing protein [Alphaproteobacteria bacterium]MBL6952938.1 ribbon-helix-helix domain-containing protein [Alphaproteobacteria bacterium]